MRLFVWAANLLGWPVIHLGIARAFLLMNGSRFAHEDWLTRERAMEQNGTIYHSVFAVQRWKGLLPDGAPWVGGAAKKRLSQRTPAYLDAFLNETRRAEWAHWCMLGCTPVFFLWNPPWACAVMTLYGVAANLPCILAQRANRIRLKRVLRRASAMKTAQ